MEALDAHIIANDVSYKRRVKIVYGMAFWPEGGMAVWHEKSAIKLSERIIEAIASTIGHMA